MKVCHIYLKAGSVIELHGSEFSVTYGRLENDLRNIKWEDLDIEAADPLWLDVTAVAAVVVSDK